MADEKRRGLLVAVGAFAVSLLIWMVLLIGVIWSFGALWFDFPQGEAYSALGGLYRQFELTYVVADERDVIRVRTNHRKGEDVYLYRLQSPSVKESFLEYVRTINELHETPRGTMPSLTIAPLQPVTNGPRTSTRLGITGGSSMAWGTNCFMKTALSIPRCRFLS